MKSTQMHHPKQPVPRRQPGDWSWASDVPAVPRRLRGRHCECGQCALCLENARWERIFRQKFADPEYYEPRLVCQSSPLAP
jgi:hypothetical protein